ncbi:hypothetical protein PGT21_022488 [Puccinia graminis f. sp. tritici]|uniref:Uncharacterized protein n=1 Tax=Puccinia graminis f. sp. tritici TaxID=56615 RepID=A0A5B0QFV4_PUCGR|nr:hypothetical protein PGT21_022488 [Puccinia graminis f. sp. tritici]
MDNGMKFTHSKATGRKDPETAATGNTEQPAQTGHKSSHKPVEDPAPGIGSQPHDPGESDGEESIDLISKNPTLTADTLKEVVEATSIPPEVTKTDQRSHVWEKLKQAQAAGDTILAKILLAAYNKLEPEITPSTPKLTRSVSALPIMTSTEFVKEVGNPATSTELEDNLVYAVGAVTSHNGGPLRYTTLFDH